MQRTARYYGKNEAATMRDLGLSPVPRSGAGWVHKEDGENEAILCQLKSTDAAEARIRRIDLDRLAYHAAISHKAPLFAIQFLNDGKIYFVVEKDKFAETAKALEGKSKAEQVSPSLPCAGATQEGEPAQNCAEEIYSAREARDVLLAERAVFTAAFNARSRRAQRERRQAWTKSKKAKQ